MSKKLELFSNASGVPARIERGSSRGAFSEPKTRGTKEACSVSIAKDECEHPMGRGAASVGAGRGEAESRGAIAPGGGCAAKRFGTGRAAEARTLPMPWAELCVVAWAWRCRGKRRPRRWVCCQGRGLGLRECAVRA